MWNLKSKKYNILLWNVMKDTVLQWSTRTSDLYSNITKKIPAFVRSYLLRDGKAVSHFLPAWIFPKIRTGDLPVRTSSPSWLKRMCSENMRNVLESQLWPRPLGFYGSFPLDRSETGWAVSAESEKTAPNIITSEQQRKENFSCTVWGKIFC